MTAPRVLAFVIDAVVSLVVAGVGAVTFFLVISWLGITPTIPDVALAYGCGWFFGRVGKRS